MVDFTKLKVLVVEDELNIRKIIKTILSSMGVPEIVEATNGRDALDLLKLARATTGNTRRRFDLIVCDWMMPQMSGFELLENVRANRFMKHIPFLMVTAQNEVEPVMQAITSGANDYIVKPFTVNVFEAKVRSIMERAAKAE